MEQRKIKNRAKAIMHEAYMLLDDVRIDIEEELGDINELMQKKDDLELQWMYGEMCLRMTESELRDFLRLQEERLKSRVAIEVCKRILGEI